MRRLRIRCAAVPLGALAALLTVSPAGVHAVPLHARLAATPQYPNWPMYHRDRTHSGYDPSATTAGATLTAGWNVPLDGAVYAEPLFVNDMAIVVTENDTVYAIRYNHVLWHTHLGSPVPQSQLPCGDIDPLGMTGTPVYDAASNSLFVSAEFDYSIRHSIIKLDASTGVVVWRHQFDPTGSTPGVEQQRGALALSHGYVWIPLGGLDGDCGDYHGYVVGFPMSGSGSEYWLQVAASSHGAGIWAASGPASDAYGNLFYSTGNSWVSSSGQPYDYSDGVLKMSGTSSTRPISYFAPSSWYTDNANDADLGSTGPAITGSWIFQDGKTGWSYLLNPASLGGIGHPEYAHDFGCTSFGGTAYFEGIVYVPCTQGLLALRIGSGPSLTKIWQAPSSINGSPIVGGGRVWSLSTGSGTLYELNPFTGAVVTHVATGPVSRFMTPTLHGAGVVVATTDGHLRSWVD